MPVAGSHGHPILFKRDLDQFSGRKKSIDSPRRSAPTTTRPVNNNGEAEEGESGAKPKRRISRSLKEDPRTTTTSEMMTQREPIPPPPPLNPTCRLSTPQLVKRQSVIRATETLDMDAVMGAV